MFENDRTERKIFFAMRTISFLLISTNKSNYLNIFKTSDLFIYLSHSKQKKKQNK